MTLEGQILGDFRVLHEIGRGGMGIVYLAKQISLPRQVALKIIPGTRGHSAQILARFRREAEAASKLDHPNICAVYATGVHESIPYIAMRYVEGQPLSRILREKRRASSNGEAGDAKSETSSDFRFDFSEPSAATLQGAPPATQAPDREADQDRDAGFRDPDDIQAESSVSASKEDVRWAVDFIEKTARALHAAHEAQVIHRDIKPGNIMVTPSEDPVILDFGLARDLDGAEGPSLTQSGDVMGTPHYMSPEQLRGGRVDARTDVYSLGVTLYELIAGRRPFEAPNRERLYKSILDAEFRPLSQLNPVVERDLEIVLATALERDLNRRYQTARAFAHDLRAVLNHEPIAARPIGPWLRFRKWARRSPGLASGLVAAFVVLSLLLVEARYYAGKLKEENLITIRAKNRADELAVAAAKSAREAQQSAKVAREAAERNAALVDEKERALRHSKAAQLASEASARANTDPALAMALAHAAREIEPTQETDQALRIALNASPPLRRFAAPLFDSNTTLSTLNRTPRSGSSPFGAVFAPTRLINSPAETGIRARVRAQTAPTGDVHWASDLVVTLAQDRLGVPCVWRISTGELVCVLSGHLGPVLSARFRGDGKRIVTGGEDGTIRIFDALSGSQIQQLDVPSTGLVEFDNTVEEVAFSRRGRTLIATCARRIITWIASPRTGDFRPGPRIQDRYRVLNAPPQAVRHPRFPIIASVATNRVVIWSEFQGPETVIKHFKQNVPITAIAWAQQGRVLAIGDRDGGLSVWRLSKRASGKAVLIMQKAGAHQGAMTALAFSPSGLHLASGSDDLHLMVWDVTRKRALWRPRTVEGTVRDLEWSADGSWLAVGSTDDTARVFDGQSGRLLRRLGGHDDWVTRVRFAPDRSRLMAFSYGGPATLHDLRAGSGDLRLGPLPREIRSVQWSQDSNELLVTCRDGGVRLFSLEDASSEPKLLSTVRELHGAIWLSDGRRIACFSNRRQWLSVLGGQADGAWNVQSSSGTTLPAGSTRDLASMTDDGSLLGVVGPSGIPMVLDQSGKPVLELPPMESSRRCLIKARPGFNQFVIWRQGPPILLDPLNPRDSRPLLPGLRNPKHIAMSPDGRWAAFTDILMRCSLVDLDSGEAFPLAARLSAPPTWLEAPGSLAVAPQGGLVEVLSVTGQALQQVLAVNASGVTRLLRGSRPDELLILSQGEIILWDLARNTPKASLAIGSAAVEDIELSPDGRRLALGLANGLLQVFLLDPQAESPQTIEQVSAAAMERFEIGTPEQREAISEAERTRARKIEIAALRGRALHNVSASANADWARRVTRQDDPLSEFAEEVRQRMEFVVQSVPNPSPALRHVLARACYACGDKEEALSILESTLKGMPQDEQGASAIREDMKRFADSLTDDAQSTASPGSAGSASK